MDFYTASVYAKEKLLPKLKDESFFSRAGLTESMLSIIDSLLNASTLPPDFQSSLGRVSLAPLPAEVLHSIQTYVQCMYLEDLLCSETSEALSILKAIDAIQDPQLNKEIFYLTAISKLEKEIRECRDLAVLSKYPPLINTLESGNKESLCDTVFLQISHLVDISNADILYMAETLNSLKSFAGISASPVIIKTLAGQLISKLKFNEMASSLPEEIKTGFEIEPTEKVIQAINLIREVSLDETMQEDYNKLDEVYKALQPPQVSVEGSVEALAQAVSVVSVEDSSSTPIPSNNIDLSLSQSQSVEYDPTITDRLPYSPESYDLLENLPIKSWDQIRVLEKIVDRREPGKQLEVFKCLVQIEGNEIMVAVKVNHTQAKDQSLSDQASYMALMQDNRNFLKLYGAFWEHAHGMYRFSLVMELAKETLSDKIRYWETQNMDKAFREAQAFSAAQCLISAMNELNERGITHRDIKPDNIFITADGIYKIADFDISKKVERNAYGGTVTCIDAGLAGTMKYVAPELKEMQTHGIVKKNLNYNVCDVYSLGLTVLRMMTKDGEVWWNTPSDYLERMIGELVDKNVSIPKFNRLIKDMLTMDLKKRPKFRNLLTLLNQEESTFAAF